MTLDWFELNHQNESKNQKGNKINQTLSGQMSYDNINVYSLETNCFSVFPKHELNRWYLIIHTQQMKMQQKLQLLKAQIILKAKSYENYN